ncbi:MAG: 2-C-methyl-D-erythritol 4-phosphate cytidylyltransferase [Colwellia sp.]
MTSINPTFTVVVPAAGAGKRMLSDCPKQYLKIGSSSVIEHTISNLLAHPLIEKVIVSLSASDAYFSELKVAKDPRVEQVVGGKERVDSVLSGLLSVNQANNQWVLVHDAARPCVTHEEITNLIKQCTENNSGGLLAVPVVDTLKKSVHITSNTVAKVKATIDRTDLWQALTPQMYRTNELITAIENALENSIDITDESSAIESIGLASMLVLGSRQNIKITRPEDLALASFYLNK